MTRMVAVIFTLVLGLSGLGIFQASTAEAHDLQVVVPVYFRASDQSDRQATFKPKIDTLLSEATNFYSSAHLSSGDSIRVNAAISRTGSQTKSWYCNGANPCTIDHVFSRAISDLSNPASSAYIG